MLKIKQLKYIPYFKRRLIVLILLSQTNTRFIVYVSVLKMNKNILNDVVYFQGYLSISFINIIQQTTFRQ
jgi:hypothetical protein